MAARGLAAFGRTFLYRYHDCANRNHMPGLTYILVTLPATGDGISTTALSVSTSNKGDLRLSFVLQ